MDWKDKRHNNIDIFDNLDIGQAFIEIDTNILFIKVSYEKAFDVCNNEMIVMDANSKVEARKATLVLD